MKIPTELTRYLQKSTRIAVLTGAGISAESGLQTFREAQDGLWSQYRPEDLATPDAFARDPKLVWDWYTMRREKVIAANPNPGHDALVDMESYLPDFTLITQNVDGYHKMAGNKNILELHGNIQQVRCSNGCGVIPEEEWKQRPTPSSRESFTAETISKTAQQTASQKDGGVPRCPKCNAYLRPDVVWFGESLPLDTLHAAVEASTHCQVFFSVGTSGLVQPAATLPLSAKKFGAVFVEINLDPTPLSPHADFALHGKSGEILPQLVKEVWG
jgi:NAD-dependent deacetylase